MKAEEKEKSDKKENPVVLMKTTLGEIEIELYPEKAPETVKNFLAYVNANFYSGLIFHRVIPGFMIQGGGFSAKMLKKPTNPPIKNEADNGLKNDRGTIAMARTPEIDSATSQFFINLADNDFLNHKDDTPRGYGYAVFGRVIKGMDVVDEIAKVKTTTIGPYKNVPENPITILFAKEIK
ncbi:MAG: peptidylprolyl isomerase A [Candidatus Schekmanbacteria bacterium]|nr:MAG: peptidylprolyl isomerase A [Candidatus Schekmanbacteria bacterium]